MRSQTPTDVEKLVLSTGVAQPRASELLFAGRAANTNLPGEIFFAGGHNDWASAVVGDCFVTFYNGHDAAVKVIPIAAFKGITAVVTYPEGDVSARLVLEHEEENWSVFLTRPLGADDFGRAWEAWIEALDMPARLKRQKDVVLAEEGGAISGNIFPSRKRKGIQVLPAKPRRARAFYRERRPKFLVFRNAGI